MEEPRVFTAEARELDRAERGPIVCACEEGHKRLEKKKEERKSDSRQKRAREEKKEGGVEKEEAKQQRGEREMTRGVEGWRET